MRKKFVDEYVFRFKSDQVIRNFFTTKNQMRTAQIRLLFFIKVLTALGLTPEWKRNSGKLRLILSILPLP